MGHRSGRGSGRRGRLQGRRWRRARGQRTFPILSSAQRPCRLSDFAVFVGAGDITIGNALMRAAA
ncbi:hypothetical protein GLA29479_918 [Lysobacter antibioticus]|uniref:Uncharacterized protein n=1 Tax=Lysobacter antibioticus TaxID=84531 RepID=A0A0S2FEA7_LYSAN|nr:hypothetical protein GLA29479_918 [Lysobacter antibioticus]ALN81880.1 hypothetical protein LA76x_3758 [Lysobacter antibioticus]